MLENNRDEINYHKFLKSVRKSQKVSLEKTAFGVCTKSGMSRIEAGTRLPDKLVRDRLTARLGISGEEYEEYLLPREYEQWLLRMDIIRCINKKDIDGAEENLKAYEDKYNENCVEKQFVEAMRFMIYEMKGYSDEVLCTQAYTAMICTIPDIDAAFKGAQLLADQELNLIMEYVRLYVPKIPENNATEWKLKYYDKIANYVVSSSMDKIAQAKVYSKLACLVSELVLAKYAKEESLRYALELCTRAIEVLRDRYRLYYFVELNEYRVKIIEKLDDSTDEVEELSRTSKEWAKVLSKLYIENDLPIYMENYTYLYTETECNNISDVIRIRRKMMGLPRRMFSGQCDERSLLRIENGEVNPTMAIVRDLFERMGLCAEYKRARVVTSDRDAMQLLLDLMIEINTSKFEKAHQTHKELYNKIDRDIIYNEQELKRMEVAILRGLGRISKDEIRELLIDTIECTLSLKNFFEAEEKYLTANELECIHNFLMFTDGKEVDKIKLFCEDICANLMEINEFEISCLTKYEMILHECAYFTGNAEEYIKSRLISRKLLKESLRNRRLLFVTNCEYNELWVYQKLAEVNGQMVDNKYVHDSLKRCLLLSDISKKEDWKKFFQQKLQ